MRPIVVDLGRAKKKDLKALERGEGPLVQVINQVLEELNAGLPAEDKKKRLVPVVVRYEKKDKKTGPAWMLGA